MAAVLVPVSSTAVLQGVVAAINIKKRMLSERALRDSETRYRRLFETAQDGLLILDAKAGSITDVSASSRLSYEHTAPASGECLSSARD